MKKVSGYLLLALLCGSLFFLVFIPLETMKLVQAWEWEAVEVEIIQNDIKHGSRGHYPEVRVRDLETDEISGSVAFRYGDMSLSFNIAGWLGSSTLYTDRDNYPVGTVTTAYRSPDAKEYVLEQNSATLMITLFVLSLIMPSYAAYHIIKNRVNED